MYWSDIEHTKEVTRDNNQVTEEEKVNFTQIKHKLNKNNLILW